MLLRTQLISWMMMLYYQRVTCVYNEPIDLYWYTNNDLLQILMFSDQSMMSSSSLAIPSGTLGFVADEQRLYIRVNLGWQAIMVRTLSVISKYRVCL